MNCERPVVLITGASSGIGRALAVALARRGCVLAINARGADRLDALAAELRKMGCEVEPFAADLADPDTPARLVEAVADQFGRLDVLVNNAGFGLPRFFADCEPGDLRQQIEVNLTAPILLTRHALPHLLAARGMVINVGSAITAGPANPVFGLYGMTKAALAYWNDALRRELRHRGVTVCLVEPGPVDTGFFDAVNARSGEEPSLGTTPAVDGLYNALRDRPPRLFTADVDEAARRIARLLDRPRRRLSFPRRIIWPWRLLGAASRPFPGLMDVALSTMVRRIERERQRIAEGAHARAGR